MLIVTSVINVKNVSFHLEREKSSFVEIFTS